MTHTENDELRALHFFFHSLRDMSREGQETRNSDKNRVLNIKFSLELVVPTGGRLLDKHQ